MDDRGLQAPVMSTPPEATTRADRASRDAALTLGLVLPTDTVLYLLLPMHAAEFGVSLAEAGVLLAVNRLVRIFGYCWVSRSYERQGPRVACIGAVLGAVGSSLGYALLPGFWWLVVARLMWGLSFAALNIATQALATAQAQGAARRNGRSRAIIAAGPMLGLVAGAVIAMAYGPHVVFLVLAAVALLALPFAWRLPAGQGTPIRSAGPRFSLPAPLDVWSFVNGFALDGIFILGLSVLAARANPEGAVLAAGLAMALRYVAEVLLGPPGGALAERFGAERLLVLLSLSCAVGLVLIGLGVLWAGAVGIMLLRGLLQPLPAPVTAAAYPGAERVPALARQATWRDLGAGLGPIAAGLLLPLLSPPVLYGATAAALALAALAVHRRYRQASC